MKGFLLVFAFFATTVLWAQNGFLEGIVSDEKGNPIEGADVIYRKDVTRGAVTNEKGYYRLELPSGQARIICRFSDMKTDTSSISVISNSTVNHSIRLKSLVKELEQFEVKVGKFDKSIEEQTVSMVVIKPQMIENKNTRSIETALDQTPGLNILDGEPQIRGGSGFTFGVGSKVAIIVDDMPMLSGDAGRPEWGFVPVENISQIEVVKGPHLFFQAVQHCPVQFIFELHFLNKNQYLK
jgi:iron complex outermembrane receptor protein